MVHKAFAQGPPFRDLESYSRRGGKGISGYRSSLSCPESRLPNPDPGFQFLFAFDCAIGVTGVQSSGPLRWTLSPACSIYMLGPHEIDTRECNS